MRIEGRVGVAKNTDDSEVPPRLGSQGEVMVSQLGGKYTEPTNRGMGFVYATAANGVPLAIVSSTSPTFMIWNPAGSQKNLELTKVVLGYVTIADVAGHVCYSVLNNTGSQIGTNAPIVSLTGMTATSLLTNSGNQSSIRCGIGNTLANAPTYLCPMGASTVVGTFSTTQQPWVMTDDIDGRIIVPPGNAFFVSVNASMSTQFNIAAYGIEVSVPLSS